MRHVFTILLLGLFLGLAAAQPPKEEEDPKAKPTKPIDIESFPPEKTAPKSVPKDGLKSPDGPGMPHGPGVLVVGVRSLPQQLSPKLAGTDPDRWALDLLFDGLLRPSAFDAGTTFAPNLAASMDAESNGRAFHLDPRAKWSDGTPVLANDVLSTLEKLRTANRGDATSDAPRRVRIGLVAPSPDPAALFTFKVLPAARKDDEEFARSPLGSGPFIYGGVTTQGGRSYALFPVSPTAAQRAQPPSLREVRFLAAPDPLADLRRGLADVVLEERTSSLTGLAADVRIAAVPSRRIYYLAVNPIKFGGDGGRSLRRAIAFGIRREVILDEIWRAKDPPQHKALTGPFPAGSWPCDPAAPTLDDPTLARAELHSATEQAEKFKLVLIYQDDDPAAGPACALIKNQLEQLGMKCEAKGLGASEFSRDLSGGQYDLAYRHFDFHDNWFDPAELFSPAHGGSSPRLDAALARSASLTEFATLRDARRKLHREFRDAMPFVPLWCLDVHVVLRRGVEPYPSPDRLDPLAPLADIDRWRVSR